MRVFSNVLNQIFLCIGLIGVAHAEVQLEVDVSSPQVEVGESLQLRLTVTADSARPGEIEPKFSAPDFEILGQNSSTSFNSSFDGSGLHTTSSRALIFELQPKHAGSLTIRDISVKVGSKVLKAADIAIRVGGGAPAGPKGGSGSGSAAGGAGTGGATTDGPRHHAVWLETQVSNEHPVLGEQVIVSYVLYARTRVMGTSATAFPAFPGFLKEDLEMPMLGNVPNREERVQGPNGEPLSRFVLAKFALYPLKVGKLSVEGFQIRAQVLGSGRRGGRDDEEDMFDSSLRQFFQTLSPRLMMIAAEPKTIEVSALPPAAPDFANLVGSFELEGRVDPPSVDAGKPFTYTVVIRGRGQLSKLEKLPLPKLDGVEVFESKGHTRALGSGVSERIFETLLVPRNPGVLTLPRFELNVFDPEQKKFVTLSHEPLTVQVTGTAQIVAPSVVQNQTAGVDGSTASNVPGNMVDQPLPETLGASQMVQPSKALRIFGRPLWHFLAALCGLLSGVLALGWLIERVSAGLKRRRSRAVPWTTDRIRSHLDSLREREDLPEAFLSWRQILMDQKTVFSPETATLLERLAILAEAARFAPPSERRIRLQEMKSSW